MNSAEKQRQREFLECFTMHEAAIRAYVRRLVPSRADADDVMQEVAVVLWEKFDRFRKDANFKAWAFGVARFEVLGWLRDRGRDRLVLREDVAQLVADESTRDEARLARQRETLENCMKRLDHPQRELLMEAYQPRVSIRDLAVQSGRSVTGFYQWLHRVRRLLLDCVRREFAREALS